MLDWLDSEVYQCSLNEIEDLFHSIILNHIYEKKEMSFSQQSLAFITLIFKKGERTPTDL